DTTPERRRRLGRRHRRGPHGHHAHREPGSRGVRRHRDEVVAPPACRRGTPQPHRRRAGGPDLPAVTALARRFGSRRLSGDLHPAEHQRALSRARAAAPAVQGGRPQRTRLGRQGPRRRCRQRAVQPQSDAVLLRRRDTRAAPVRRQRQRQDVGAGRRHHRQQAAGRRRAGRCREAAGDPPTARRPLRRWCVRGEQSRRAEDGGPNRARHHRRGALLQHGPEVRRLRADPVVARQLDSIRHRRGARPVGRDRGLASPDRPGDRALLRGLSSRSGSQRRCRLRRARPLPGKRSVGQRRKPSRHLRDRQRHGQRRQRAQLVGRHLRAQRAGVRNRAERPMPPRPRQQRRPHQRHRHPLRRCLHQRRRPPDGRIVGQLRQRQRPQSGLRPDGGRGRHGLRQRGHHAEHLARADRPL
ncbi:MAG: hypothetical protein AVDCRST_MAG38-491, partial [uncultured Solirubrobacteraceae bacterium]